MDITYTLVDKHISNTINKFYLCTNLPIKAYRYDGTLIHSIGNNRELDDLYNREGIYELLMEDMIRKEDCESNNIIYCLRGLFTACRICPKSINRGIYIIGPFNTYTPSDNQFRYIPSQSIPHLITLIYNLASDSAYIRQKNDNINSLQSIYVKRALDFIDARYNEEITLNEITRHLQISRSYFCSLLKRETDKTFSQLLNEIRIEKSKQLLLKGRLSILEVALAVGFNNQNYYTMAFKKLNNITPLEFRNKG
ncbi:MAG: helix-turn-helix transcriptional regulator [Flavobacteriales bacterium]|nr:helix-turn-helix transcriptional regulator [Flavobacteriales bacterium]